MTRYPIDWVDAFTDRPFGGNGCAVVYDGQALDLETRLSFTRETGLVECTFIEPSDVADLRVRYYLAAREIPFAGHPTIASVASALSRGLLSGPHLTLETGAGVMAISVDGDQITMTQTAPVFGPTVSADLIAAVVGLTPHDILGVPQITSTGLPFCITVVKTHEALRRARLDPAALARFQRDVAVKNSDAMEPYLVTLQGVTDMGRSFSRLLLPPPNPPEDPFTGSATGAAAAYLWHHGLIDTPTYIAEQGHWMGRPGQAQVEILGQRDAITGVKVGGSGYVLMSGALNLTP